MEKVKVGLLGCGVIAPAYLRNLQGRLSPYVQVIACADLVPDVAANRAREFSVARACSPDELLGDPRIELVINLTPAPQHHAASLSILRAGKHLFSEKPLALDCAAGAEILSAAASRRLLVAGAADTFLGAGLQECRRLVDSGRIGTPIAAQAIVSVNMFHSERYHRVFRGALFDLGPYYLTALVALLGPVRRVAGAAEIRFPEKRHPDDSPNAGQAFTTDIPSTAAAVLTFECGAVGTIVASGDVSGYFPRVEIYGTAGTLVLNDANHYGGAIMVNTPARSETITPTRGFADEGRGLGVAEMALALREGREPRSSGALMYHILETMVAVHDSSCARQHRDIASRIERPAPFDFA
jgi:predicted dehydrogenase